MPVTAVTGAALSLQRNHVYVIPSPALPLVGTDTVAAAREAPGGIGSPFDTFLRGLADAHQGCALAVMLSDTGSAAQAGMTSIKEEGGIVIAESRMTETPPTTACAADASAADFVLPVEDISSKLGELWGSACSLESNAPGQDTARPVERRQRVLELDHALREILAALFAHTGHDFSHYKRATVLRRIERRIQINGLPHLRAYRAFLLATPAEARPLLQDLLIGVTQFFRDQDAFAALRQQIVPALFEQGAPDKALRIWVPGCATGEEAYSLAMLLRAHADQHGEQRGAQLFATDVDARAIGCGRLGRYADVIASDLPQALLLQHFRSEPPYYQVGKPLREMVLFAQHDLLRDPPFSHLDLVSCRNVLIYLDPAVQRQVLRQFHFSLRPGGFLFLGGAENVDSADDLFEVVDKQHRIFRSKWQARSRRPAMEFPVQGVQPGAIRGATPMPPTPAPAPMFVSAMHEQTMLRYGPPSIMVNHRHDVLHLSERAGPYLRHIGGEPSQWLPDIVRPELKIALRAALHEAVNSGREAAAPPILLLQNGRSVYVTISVYPVQPKDAAQAPESAHAVVAPPPASSEPLALVVFHEYDAANDAAPGARHLAAVPGDAALHQAIEALERELRDARRQTRATLEHADASTDALEASNEELQAMNEELHSTTEELETSKEELQSINEELLTVNAELQAKILKSGKVNDDLLNLISSSDIATVFVDRSMVLSRYTPAAAALFNVMPSDIGRSLLDITHHLVYPDLASDAATTFESLKLIEKEVAGPDGRWYLSRLSPYRTAEDRIDGAVLTLIDITSRREAQAKMRTSEKRLQLIAQSTNDYAIIIHDLTGTIVAWSKGAERMFGYVEAEMLGRPGTLIYAEKDLRAGVRDAEVERMRIQGRSQDEGWLVRKDGTRLYCSGVTTALHGDDFQGYAKIARDLTDGHTAESAKQLQHSLERSVREQVDTANRTKDEFLAVLSHELKNPLNLIHVKAEMLSRAPDARHLAVVQEASDAIRRSVAAQAKIIDDLLDLSRVRTGKLTLDEAPVDLTHVIDAAVDALEEDAAAAGLTLVASGTRGQAVVLADSIRIEQIVWNLLSNALKFTPAGGHVEIALTTDGDDFLLSVRDNGQGIDPAFLPHIFNMFSQAESAFNRARDGLGIGLALVQQLTQMQGGRVSAASEGIGRGACFRVWLPRCPTGAHIAPALPPVDAAVLRGKRILLVDDTLETLEAFRALLEMEGAQVRMECNGPDALRAVAEEHFDLVLSDIGMPGMDGYELIRALRSRPDTAAIPAVAMTGFGRSQDVDRALSAGFNLHLGKPVSFDALLGAIYGALALAR